MKPANNAPIYACVYAELAEIARAHGYALAIHGSLARDFDCIAIPWTEEVAAPQTTVNAMLDKFSLVHVPPTSTMSHGRLVYTLAFKFGDVFVDLSFMPRKDTMSEDAVELRHQLATANEYALVLEQRLATVGKRLEHTDGELAQARVSRDTVKARLLELHDRLHEMGIDLTVEVPTKENGND